MGRGRYSPEVRERAIRMVLEHENEYGSQWAAIGSIAPKIGCAQETLRKWVRQAERDSGAGLTSDERARFKELEERYRELVEELDAYARVVAHDLKNPLTVITGYVELLEMRCGADLDEEDQSLLQGTMRTCGTMVTIINELLLLAHVRSLDNVSTAPLEMGEIIGEVMERLSEMIAESNAEIVMPESWPVAEGYTPWVQEVWANYVSNAIKYGGSPPRVELGARQEANGLLRFWVKDNGEGIAEEQQALLVQEFSRLQPSRADSHGLGLSVVKRIVDKLGGQVGVESSVGVGSTFWFTLPAFEELDSTASRGERNCE